MKTQKVEMYPKLFTYFAGELHFCSREVLRGLYFKVEPYAPRMQTCANGRLKYVRVSPYNLKWLKKNQKGEPVPEGQRVEFEPVSVWLEDRWTFVRRTAGDELTQKLFYKVCAFIWTTNDIAMGDDIQRYQDVKKFWIQ